MPSISIVVPVYNAEQYIDRCISSLLGQTFLDFEIILVDDGSTDSSWQHCIKWTQSSDKVSAVQQKNMGVSAARNNGIKQACGQYLTFIDSDDFVSKNLLTLLIEGYQKYERVDLSIIGYRKQKDNGKIDIQTQGVSKVLTREESFADIFLDYGFEGYPFNKLFKTQLIRENNLLFATDITICEDLLFCVQYLKLVNQVAYNPYPAYYYNIRDNSALTSRQPGTPFNQQWLTEITAYQRINKIVPQQFSEAQKRLKAREVWVYSFMTRLVLPAHNIENKRELIKQLNQFIRNNLNFFMESTNYPKYDKIILKINLYFPWMIFYLWKLYLKFGSSGLKSE
ncbi:glycosyltransferase family 2 protein [Loigolactobacillus zhaoyuanensis]|uniref:Glycosyltransferase family 2 protein n=1 Tax=Loigolactobacillus zhaoyuanensis TaxID=2486017 RepID=A0ABW8UEW4_9LACO